MIEPLDYELSHEYYITIEATDGGSPPLSDMATVNINLTDVNDNRPAFSQDVYTAVISEDTELGRTVIMVRIYIKWFKRPLRAAENCILGFSTRHSVVCSLKALSSPCLFLSACTYYKSAPVANHHLAAQLNWDRCSSSLLLHCSRE